MRAEIEGGATRALPEDTVPELEELLDWQELSFDAEQAWQLLAEQLRREGVLQGCRPDGTTFGPP